MRESHAQHTTLAVSEDDNGLRLDRYLCQNFPELKRVTIHKMIRLGAIKVDSHKSKPFLRLSPGMQVLVPHCLEPSHPTTLSSRNQNSSQKASLKSLSKMIMYSDDDLIVLNKPYGLASQGGSGLTTHLDQLLCEAYADHKTQPRLVHRLDRETTGCLVVAKNRVTAKKLSELFRTRTTTKLYWALVHGVPKKRQGTLTDPLVKIQNGRANSKVVLAEPQHTNALKAITQYQLVASDQELYSWLILRPITGRTHQLRVHLAHVGNPIVGDEKYARGFTTPDRFQNRLHLHARQLVFEHPKTLKKQDFIAPLPDHMLQAWEICGFNPLLNGVK